MQNSAPNYKFMLEQKLVNSLQAKHPLLSKLNGQAIWVACEAYGMDEEHIIEFMDSFMELSESTLETMHKLENNPDSFLFISSKPSITRNLCPNCNQLNGCLVPANNEKMLSLLPPYSITCMCRAHYLSKAEAEQYASDKGLVVADLFPKIVPDSDIYCQDDYLPDCSDF